MDHRQNYEQWLRGVTEEERRELEALAGNEEEQKRCFGSHLAFGTGGMRGIMGLGSSRLNRYTVRRAAQGMAAWLKDSDLPQKVAIAYDSRHNSRFFAERCAVAFAEAGIAVYLYDRLAPTPMLSFAVRELGCGCGVVISASHNAAEYNGVKCYGPDGCQLTDEPAAVVIGKIGQIPYFQPEQADFDTLLAQGKITFIGSDLWQSYYRAVLAQAIRPEGVRKAGLRVVYTPLCGTGNEPVRHILAQLGAEVTVVSAQEKPDGDFKTCPYPNPETDEAMAESYKTAAGTSCDVIFGTDPDCDRLAVAIPRDGSFVKLTGNELGCLLLDYILSSVPRLPQGAEAVRSIVSSPMADRVAERYGCKMVRVLTGFKYIGGEILRLEQLGQEDRFLFGFEESCGYLKGSYVRDKDGVLAAMLVCEMAADYKNRGMTLLDGLQELYDTHGYYLTGVDSMALTGADAMERAAAYMAGLREKTWDRLAGKPVVALRDYKSGVATDCATGQQSSIDLPGSDVLELLLQGGSSVIVRPSGTEPKVKFYYTAVGRTRQEAHDLLAEMKQAL